MHLASFGGCGQHNGDGAHGCKLYCAVGSKESEDTCDAVICRAHKSDEESMNI
jgi:hypothetical protein